jgi:transcriptional regulator
MYLPEAFRETRPEVLEALIRAHPLGLLISNGSDGPLVSPVPFTLVPGGAHGILRAHLARANPHWRALQATPAALALFQGPAAYVSPSWYATKRETGKVVPTWNYAMVEARGEVAVIEDAGWLRSQIEALTGMMEAGRPEPWAVSDAPEPFVSSQVRGIVGIELPVASLAGKWKVSQNRPPADRRGVAAGLTADGDPAMDALVAERDTA